MSTEADLRMDRLREAITRAVADVAAKYPEASVFEIAEALRLVHKQQVKTAVDYLLAEHRSGEESGV